MHDCGCTSDGSCPVPPHPKRLESMLANRDPSNITHRRLSADSSVTTQFGLGDGVIFPPERFPQGTQRRIMKQAAAAEPPLRGPLNVLIILTSYKDQPIRKDAVEYFKRLFFSKGEIKTGSVKEYYVEVSGGLVSITGKVFGPYVLPEKAQYYARDGWGFKEQAADTEPPNPDNNNVRTMAGHALDALLKEKPNVDLKEFDNAGRAEGTVDAFIVVHAGPGGELLNSNPAKDIWSVKWSLKKERVVGKSKTKVYGFLTLPEDAKTGVSAHEIGHLVFGWPDLYDPSNRSRGVRNWCLMSGGTWGSIVGTEPGTVPCHPSAWCKLQQGWVDVHVGNNRGTQTIMLNDVKVIKGSKKFSTTNASPLGTVYKLCPNGDGKSKQYFLIESRMRYGFDASLPGEGLLIWHIDDTVLDNGNLNRYRVTLLNADFKITGRPVSDPNFIDGEGCPFPGSTKRLNPTFDTTSIPAIEPQAQQDTFISITNISEAGPTMSMDVTVQPPLKSKL
ncbi:immune inhibitor A [Rhypophila decipiens]|uniref:Immune inhibitor A n=1 Tax=Rhypophila decipiens TaxID=261697 RepID=A0AAN6Y9K8_9PEZI|nr:immune inhibitor A [Rhypophila decipiens]